MNLVEQDRAGQFEHPSDLTSMAKPATESDCSYAKVQGISEQQVDANEDTYAEIKENELHPYQLSAASNEAPPEPTDHMHAAVAKEQKLPNTTSEEMFKPTQAARISVPPAKPALYKCKICLYVFN